MRKKVLAIAATAVLAATTITACDSSSSSSGTTGAVSTTTVGKGDGKARVGVILPDEKSSARWTQEDPKDLKAAFAAAGVPAEIENAKGNAADFVKIAQNMVDNGVKVLMIVNLDSDSGKLALDAAKAKKIPTIDYDRLTLNGGADYYVSFDNEQVGFLQALGLENCLTKKKVSDPVIAELNGSPTDNNATQFKDGYDGELLHKYDTGDYEKGPDQSVPDWDPEQGGVIFAQMLQQRPDIRGVLAANDGLAGAVIKVLKKHGLNGKVPVTGQDATVEGLQAIMAGDQCMTIFKNTLPEAQTAANLAIQLYKGEKPSLPAGSTIKDPESGALVPFKSLTPQAVTRNGVDSSGGDDSVAGTIGIKDVVSAGYVSAKELCTAAYAKYCDELGIK